MNWFVSIESKLILLMMTAVGTPNVEALLHNRVFEFIKIGENLKTTFKLAFESVLPSLISHEKAPFHQADLSLDCATQVFLQQPWFCSSQREFLPN